MTTYASIGGIGDLGKGLRLARINELRAELEDPTIPQFAKFGKAIELASLRAEDPEPLAAFAELFYGEPADTQADTFVFSPNETTSDAGRIGDFDLAGAGSAQSGESALRDAGAATPSDPEADVGDFFFMANESDLIL